MHRRYRIAVLMGGVSNEREVSFKSGAAVASALRGLGHHVFPLDVSERSLEQLDRLIPDLAFVALRGAFGEDGEVQALIEQRGIPYTGSRPAASRLGMDKVASKRAFIRNSVPTADYLVAGPDAYAPVSDAVLSQANGGMSSLFAGLAQAALDLAIDYAKERIQGGVPIFEHQSVKARLFEMFRKVEAARALSRRANLYNALNFPPRLEYAVAAKVTSTNTAFEVASAALQIFGGNGLSREYPIEKLLRDARASMIEDGCNEVLGLAAAERL